MSLYVNEFFVIVSLDDELDVKGGKKEKKVTKKEKKREKGDESERSSLRSMASFSSADDINKMRVSNSLARDRNLFGRQ